MPRHCDPKDTLTPAQAGATQGMRKQKTSAQEARSGRTGTLSSGLVMNKRVAANVCLRLAASPVNHRAVEEDVELYAGIAYMVRSD